MPSHDELPRTILPIPYVTPDGLTTYGTENSDTAHPPIVRLWPPVVAPKVRG